MKELTDFDRDKLSMKVFNISRRLRQMANKSDNPYVLIEIDRYLTELNEIGTEIAGGVNVVMGKVLRS